jgi:hypothetical protein
MLKKLPITKGGFLEQKILYDMANMHMLTATLARTM